MRMALVGLLRRCSTPPSSGRSMPPRTAATSRPAMTRTAMPPTSTIGHEFVIDAPMQDLRKLLVGSRGEVSVARRITRGKAHVLERHRADYDADLHAWLIAKKEAQFDARRGGKLESAKLSRRGAPR